MSWNFIEIRRGMVRLPTATPLRYVLLCSTSYSGSTLLAFLMNAHPQIISMGEMTGLIDSVDPATYLCSCGERVVDCAFWSDVEAAMQRRGQTFSVAHFDTRIEWGRSRAIRQLNTKSLRSLTLETWRDRLLSLRPGHRARLHYYIERNAALAQSLAEVSERPVVFDTAKDRMRIRYLLRSKSLDLRVIHLVRDVRGVVNSTLRHKRQTDAVGPTLFWARFNQLMEQELRGLPDAAHGITIRYEDLCMQTENTLARLYQFCGVDPVVTLDLERAEHHILGNRMRLQKLDTIELDECWKTMLTPDQIQSIEQLSTSMRAVYGYPDAT